MKNYCLFISHSWAYPDIYKNLTNLLKQRSYFKFSDYSVPKDDPIHTKGTNAELRAAISEKIRTVM